MTKKVESNYDDHENCKCGYCQCWIRSSIKRREANNEGTRRKRRNFGVKRKCLIKKKTITSESNACKYFKPTNYFYCNVNNHLVAFIACLNRRYNPMSLEPYNRCKRCKQFDRDITQIVEKFWIDAIAIKEPPQQKQKRTLKRRRKIDIVSKSKRVIKRRKEKRTIKRREIKEKSKRTIKRR